MSRPRHRGVLEMVDQRRLCQVCHHIRPVEDMRGGVCVLCIDQPALPGLEKENIR